MDKNEALRLFDKLTDGLRSVSEEAGFSKAVLGFSGGLDSSVAAAVACKALGADNVTLFYLPYKDMDPHGFSDAKLVSDFLGTSLVYMDISRIADPYFDSLIAPTDRRRNNVLSRIRMMVLYDQSALYNALVVGAANKSELMLGRITRFGDAACDIDLLGNVYKTEIWEIAKALELPGQILSDASAEYINNIDKILPVLESSGCSAEEAVRRGFGREFAEKTAETITAAFKLKTSVILER
jgi:NAD+ synthase